MVEYSTVAVRGLQITSTYVSILMIGALLSLWPTDDPVLDPRTRKKLGKLVMVLFMPFMIGVSLAENLSADLIADGAWILAVWGCVHIVANFAMSSLVTRALGLPASIRLEMVLALTSSNSLGLPLVMLEPICNSSPVDAIKYGDDQDISCLPRATAFLFVYNLPWLPYLLGLCSYALFQESSTEKRSKCRVFVE